MDVSDLLPLAASERLVSIERREKGAVSGGDFEGSVTGTWVKLGEDGTGIVRYNEKEYKTKRIGFVSIPAGTDVELTYANGVYYSKW